MSQHPISICMYINSFTHTVTRLSVQRTFLFPQKCQRQVFMLTVLFCYQFRNCQKRVGSYGTPLLKVVNSLSPIGVWARTKTPAPWDSYSKNNTKSTVDPNTTIPQTSPPWWCRLTLLQHGIYGSARSDAGNLFKRGWARVLRLDLI